jgi:hypothetical protein
MEEREVVRILSRGERGLVQEAADGEMGQQQAVELLLDQVRRLAPQDDAGAPQVRLDLVERRLDLPATAREKRSVHGMK